MVQLHNDPIAEELGKALADSGDWWDGSPVDYPCDTIKIITSVYKGHPDYQPEWAL